MESASREWASFTCDVKSQRFPITGPSNIRSCTNCQIGTARLVRTRLKCFDDDGDVLVILDFLVPGHFSYGADGHRPVQYAASVQVDLGQVR